MDELQRHDAREVAARLERAETFGHWATDSLRLSDTDLLGHVNNTAYSVFCETGRVSFNAAVAPGMLPETCSLVVARVAINYRAETYFPGLVRTGTGVLSIGRTSFTLGQGLFFNDTCIATAEGVLVQIDKATRRPMPLVPGYAERLAAHVITL